MATGFFRWSKTPANNANATYNWAEGQPPSSVNDSARGIMSDLAQWRDDINGLLTTTTSSTAYVLTSNSAYDSLTSLHGQLIAFTPHATNTNTVGNDVTLAVDGLTAKPIRAQPGVALPGGSLILGSVYQVTYNNTDGAFYLRNMTNPYQIPLAAGMDYWGSTTPNSAFAFPAGQAISRTTYAPLFTLLGTTYGAGDGSTTFNLPDKTGRVSAMKESAATRLTTAGGGIDGATLGAVGTAAQNVTLSSANIPSLTSSRANTITVDSAVWLMNSTNGATLDFNPAAAAGFRTPTNTASFINNQSFSKANTITVDYTNASPTATKVVQPTIVCNYIMRVI